MLRSLYLFVKNKNICILKNKLDIFFIQFMNIKLFSSLYNSAIIQDNESRKLVTINVGNQGDDPVVIGEEG